MTLGIETVRVPDFHRLRRDFPDPSTLDSSPSLALLLPRTCLDTAGLGSSPFARHYWGNHCCFLFLRVLRCFSSPRLPHHSIHGDNHLKWLGCPIRISWDQGIFAPPPRFSQLIASFIASWSQGIRHAPFTTFCILRPPSTSRDRVMCPRPFRHAGLHSFSSVSLAIRLIYFNSVISMS